jgi:hypothetical protein
MRRVSLDIFGNPEEFRAWLDAHRGGVRMITRRGSRELRGYRALGPVPVISRPVPTNVLTS